MASHAEPQPIPVRGPLAIPRWATVILAMSILAMVFGVGLVVGRGTKSAPPEIHGLASERVARMIDNSLAAFDRGDFDTYAAGLTKDAVFEEPDQMSRPLRGRQQIVEQNRRYYTLGARYYRMGPVIQNGNAAAYAVSCSTCPGGWSGMDLVRFNDDLKVMHVWDFGSEWWYEP